MRQDGQVRDAAVLTASGVNAAGTRAVLGVSVALSEQEVHWRGFLQSLLERGLCGVELIGSDARWFAGCPASSLRWCAVSALSVSSAANYAGVCA